MALWQGYQLIVCEWVCLAIALLAVVIRLYVGIKGLRKVPWYRDAIVCVAVGFNIIGVSMEVAENDLDFFNVDGSLLTSRPLNEYVRALKINWAAALFANTLIYLLKMDLLFLYHELAPRAHNPKTFYFILAGWFFTFCGYMMVIFISFFSCRPFNANWSYPVPTCIASESYYFALWAIHMWSDLVIFLIPCFIISGMQMMSFKQKLAAGAAFLIGIVNIATVVATLVCILVTLKLVRDGSTNLGLMWGLWGVSNISSAIQRMTGFVIVCMPQLKTFYRLLSSKVAGRKDLAGDEAPSKLAQVHASDIDSGSPTSRGTRPYEAGNKLERG